MREIRLGADGNYSEESILDRVNTDLANDLGNTLSRVTDIVVTHIQWDHADGVERFPQARVWLQRAEFEYYVGADGSAKDRAIDPEVAAMYRRLFDWSHSLAEGDSTDPPGVRGPGSTFASQRRDGPRGAW
jgi:glyoxylase-like metal-dependent hydrolase (beta-lactamase superfamily II)